MEAAITSPVSGTVSAWHSTDHEASRAVTSSSLSRRTESRPRHPSAERAGMAPRAGENGPSTGREWPLDRARTCGDPTLGAMIAWQSGGMLEASSLVAFLTSTDLERSRRFYVGALGLAVLDSTPHALEVDANGTELRITRIAELVRAPYTVLGWSVEDLDASVAGLRGAGVRFCRYEGWPKTSTTPGPPRTVRGSPGSRTRMETCCPSTDKHVAAPGTQPRS